MKNDPELARVNQDKALVSLGLYRYRIPADGNCLFRAVASQLKLDQERYHPVLRKAAVKWMQANAEELIMGGMLDYLEEIDAASEPGAWAGQAAIVALANIFSINIAVVQGGDKGDIDIQHISPFESPMDGDEQGSVILAYMYNGHFDAVVDQEDVPNPDYETWQYEQVHGFKPPQITGAEASGGVDSAKCLGGDDVFTPCVENAEPESISLSCVVDEGRGAAEGVTAGAEAAEPRVVVSDEEDAAASGTESESCSMIEHDVPDDDSAKKGAVTSAQGACIPGDAVKQLHQEKPDTHSDEQLPTPGPEGAADDADAAKSEGPVIHREDDAEDVNRWASFFKNIHQELEGEENSGPPSNVPPPLNMRLDDIPEETQSQLATPMSTPLVTPLEMEDPWANFTRTIEQDSDQHSEKTLTDDGSDTSTDSFRVSRDFGDDTETSMSEDVTLIERKMSKPMKVVEIVSDSQDTGPVQNGYLVESPSEASEASRKEEAMEVDTAETSPEAQNMIDSDLSVASQTSSMSIALATDETDLASEEPRPTLNVQHSQDSLADVSPWSSFSQSVEKEIAETTPPIDAPDPPVTAPPVVDSLLQKIPGGEALNIVRMGEDAHFNTAQVPDKSVASVAPVPQKFKTIRNLPKQWEDVKKERPSAERDPPVVAKLSDKLSAGSVTSGQVQNTTDHHDAVSGKQRASSASEAEAVDKPSTTAVNTDVDLLTQPLENAKKKFVSSTKWENNAESAKNNSSQSDSKPVHIASIDISDVLATENCIKCEYVVKPRIRVIPVQFCGKRGATLRGAQTGSGISISGSAGQVNIPIQSNKQRIKAEIIEERGSVDINGQQTETVERQGTYTTLPDDEPSEPRIDLIEHKPPVLTPLSGSKITITDNPNVPSPIPVVKPKKRVPVRVVHAGESGAASRSVSYESQTSQDSSSSDQGPRVRNIPIVVTNDERWSRSRSHSQDSPSPASTSQAAAATPGFSDSSRPSYPAEAPSALYEGNISQRKISSSSTSTGYQSQTSSSSSFDNHDNSQELPEVFSRQRSLEAAKVWDEAAQCIGDEAEKVKQRIEAARSALGGEQFRSVGSSSASYHRGETRRNTAADHVERDNVKTVPTSHTGRGSYGEERSRVPSWSDSHDSAYRQSNRATFDHNRRAPFRSEASWSGQSSQDSTRPSYTSRYDTSGSSRHVHREVPTAAYFGDDESRYRSGQGYTRPGDAVGRAIEIHVVHEQNDPFTERLRRMTARDKPGSLFDLGEDRVTVRNLLRPLNLTFVNSLLNTEIDSFFRRDDFFTDF